MTNLSARIKDEHIQESVKKNLKKSKSFWRYVWLIIIFAFVAAITYFVFRFNIYGQAKAQDLVEQGRAAAAQTNYSEALNDFDQALLFKVVAKEAAARAAFEAAAVVSLADDNQKAQDYLRQAIKLQPDNTLYRATLIKSLIKSDNIDEAQKELDLAKSSGDDSSRQQDESAEIMFAKARLNFAKSQTSSALESLQKSIALSKDHADPEASYLWAAFMVDDDPGKAIKILEQLVSNSNSESLTAKYQALLEVSRQIKSKIGNPAYQQVLVGVALAAGQEPYAALAKYKKAIELDEDYRDAWIYRALSETRTQQWTAAKKSIEKAVELDPTYGFTLFVKGELLAAKEQWSLAADSYQRALDFGYNDKEVRLGLSRAQVAAGLKSAARATLKKALQDKALDHDLIYQELFWFDFEQQNYKQALKTADDYIKDFEAADSPTGLRALALFFLGQKSEADKISTELLARNPANSVALLVQGLIKRDQALITHATDLDYTGHVTKVAKQALSGEDFTK